MIRTSRSVVVHRPPAEVFRYLSHFESGMEWRSDLREIRRVSVEPEGPAARYREVVDWDGHAATLILEVTAFRPDERITWTIEGDAHGHGEYAVRTHAEGTSITVARELELRGPLAEGEQAISAIVRRQAEQDLGHLKDILEHRQAWRTSAR